MGSVAHVVQVSGSTATVAVIVGWDLLVASVGDSEAYLDTGAEVIQVCFLHMAYAVAEACLVALSAAQPYSPLPCPLFAISHPPPALHALLLHCLCLGANALCP